VGSNAREVHIEAADPEPIEAQPFWKDVAGQEISRTPFWWGTKGRGSFVWATGGIRAFLGIAEPSFRTFKVKTTPEAPREEYYFGLWDEEDRSLVLAKHDSLIAYGNPIAKERLMERIREWVHLGMPTGSSFKLHVYPAAVPARPARNQWLIRRRESQFLWSLS
jgi:hypothetical protein